MLLMFALLACGSGSDDTTPPADESGSPDDSGQDTAGDGPQLTAPTYSGGTCPELVEGTNEGFLSGGQERQFELRLPADPEGAPVVMGWHWLGGNATQALRYLQLASLTDEGAIVVVPESCCSEYEWDFLGSPEDNVDLALFDDLLACLYDQYDVDLSRVYATGMSAGGMWTTYLTMYRSNYLASTAIFSGGTDGIITYSSPTDPIPSLVIWGGDSDYYGPLSFETASEGFTSELLDDGHFVVNCDHDGGHTIPSEPASYYWPFFEDHPKGVSPEPWADALPDGYPDICWIASATQ